ncbi:MAG TPA: hypothetical protein DCX06_09045 [Opitutae bacterium]|nr:hypothetical protein [Opitutae bacterium]
MNNYPYTRFLALLVLIAQSFICTSLQAQSNLDDKSDAQLVAELKKRMETSLIEARPIMLELVERLKDKPERESYLFLIGLSYQDEFAESSNNQSLTMAVEYYNRYLNDFPAGNRVDFVRFNLAGAYADLQNYDEAIKFYQVTYRRSNNAVYRSESRNRMASLYIRSGQASAGVPLFLEVFNAALLNPELRAQAAAWLIQGYLANNQSDAIVPYLRYLAGRYEAIYDPAFNITLLKSGDDLFEKKDYDQAILLYSFVKGRGEIIRFYEVLIAELQQKVRYVSPESDQFIVVDGQLKAAEARLAAVKEIRAYNVDLKWRIARVYKETKRTWESLWAFVHLYEDFPEHEHVEDFLFTAYSEAIEIGDDTMAEALAEAYMAEDSFIKYEAQVIPGLARMYADDRRYEKLMKLVNDYMQAPKNFSVAAQLVNVVCSYYMVGAEYQNVREFAEGTRDRFASKEPLYEASRYWSGLSYLLLADYVRASNSMALFIDAYSRQSVFYEDTYYRYAVALFGEQKMADAEAQFIRFVDTYPQSNLRGEAELYVGDLMRSRGALEDAASRYRSVPQFTDNAAFIAKGVFALAEVLEELGQPQEAVDELEAYAKKYGQEAQLSEAYYRIGMIFDRLGRLGDRFQIHSMAIKELIGNVSGYAVDELIRSYVTDHGRYETSFADSLKLIGRLVDDAAFRKKFLTDRSHQYQFMQSAEGIYVDKELAYLLIRDRAFRNKIIETEPKLDPETGKPLPLNDAAVTEAMAIKELSELEEFFESKAASIASYAPKLLFSELLSTGSDSEELIQRMRSHMALDMLSAETAPPRYDWDELAIAPPAVIIWEAAKHRETRPEATKELYQIILDKHPYSNSVYDALLALGDLTFDTAQQTGVDEDWREALRYYDVITERFALRSKTATAHLRKGRILSELSRDEEAIQVLGQILRNPAWKGLDHAKAHLELGRAYRRQGKLDEAHGFFERLIVAYGGYAETVSWAYYYDMLTLEAMNETESVRQLVEEYKTRSAVLSNTEAYPLIDEKYAL